MAEDERFSGMIQESLLTAMAYAGQEAAPLLAILVPEHFDGQVYQDIAGRIIDYRTRFKEPPAPAHLDDIFDHVLADPEHKQRQSYNRILVGIREQAPSLNIKYLVERVVGFARSQRLKTGLIEAGERYSQGGNTRDDEVEQILQDTLRGRVEAVDYGERLSAAPLSFLDRDEFEDKVSIRTGIDPLDRAGLVPTRGELYYLMGRKKAGKSWWLQHLTKYAARQYWNVAHISLENKTPRVKHRYVQTWHSVAKRDESYILASLNKDRDGKLEDIDYTVERPAFNFSDPKDRPKIEAVIRRWIPSYSRILIKEWPSGFLTIPMLERWLDGLEATENFIPDMIVLDYPQLMRLDAKDLRGSYGRITVDLRRIAGERNLAMCAVMQSNREGERAKVLRAEHVAEDISQIATADVILTYNRTDAERRAGLARLHVAGGRNDRDGFTILISQAYDVGQFAIDSVPMMDQSYWDKLDTMDQSVQRENIGTDADAGTYDDDAMPEAAD